MGELTETSIIHLKSLLVWIAFLDHKIMLPYLDSKAFKIFFKP